MLDVVGYVRDLCNKSVTLEDFAHVKIIVLFMVARKRQNITEKKYSCLINWLPRQHTPCDMIRLLLYSSTMYAVSEYK